MKIELLVLAFLAGLAGVVLLVRPKLTAFVMVAVLPIYPFVLRAVGLEDSLLFRLWADILIVTGYAGIVLGWLLAKPSLQLNVKAPDIAAAIMLLIAVYTLPLTPSVDGMLFGFRGTYMPVLFYFLMRLLPYTPRESNRWIKWLVYGSLVLAVAGIMIHLTSPSGFYSRFLSSESIQALQRRGAWRMSSLLLNPLYFGSLMAIVAQVVLARFLAGLGKWNLILFAIFSVCTIASYTRGAWVLLLAGAAVMILVWSTRRPNRLIVVLVGAFVIMLGLGVSLSSGREIDTFQDSSGMVLSSRSPELSSALDAIRQNPVGYGLGLGQAQRKVGASGNLDLRVYDGWYLKVLVESGVIGFSLFLFSSLIVIVYLIARMRRTAESASLALAMASLGIQTGAALQALVSNVWEFYMIAYVLWGVLALTTSRNADGSNTSIVQALPAPQYSAEPAGTR